MKKIVALFLSALILISVISLAGCGETKTLKFGMGISASAAAAKNADGETNGKGEVIANIAAVLVDDSGKIVDCVFDCADNTVEFTSEGKYVAAEDFKTKYEQGDNYGMKAYGGSKKEWFEQVDAFIGLVKGKTLDEVKALLAEGGKGTDEVINAGCTIVISDFVKAIEKAVNTASDSEATENDTLNLGIVTTQSGKDATADAVGKNEIEITAVASVLNNDGQVVATSSDVVAGKYEFDSTGASTAQSADLKTKKELGDNYGMKSYGTDLNKDGEVKEWYVQAAAFDKETIGKTASGISALAADNGYGTDALQNAGCTIAVSDLVKAAVKAATVK